MYQRTFGAWLAVIVAIIWGIVMCLLMQGCAGDSDQKAECEAKAVLAEETLETAIQRSARAAVAGYYIIEGSRTWRCSNEGLEISVDYDLIWSTHRQHLTMVLYDYDGIEYFEIEKREESHAKSASCEKVSERVSRNT
jgi:hypothetical protein